MNKLDRLRASVQYQDIKNLYENAEIQIGDILLSPIDLLWSDVSVHLASGEGDELFKLELKEWEAQRVKERLRNKAKITIRGKDREPESFSKYTWGQGNQTFWSDGDTKDEIYIRREIVVAA